MKCKQLNRLAPQKKRIDKQIKSKSPNKQRNGKRKRKEWENEELKEQLDNTLNTNPMSNNSESSHDVNVSAMRAKTRCHLHRIFSDDTPKKKKQRNNNQTNQIIDNEDLNHLCNDVETKIFEKSQGKIDKKYMEYSRNLLFNLRQNKALQTKLLNKQITPYQFVTMKYTELAPQKLAKQRTLHKKQNLEAKKSISDNMYDWNECAVQCTNCGNNKCKYKMKKMLVSSTKSEVFGGASSKQQNVDMICTKCSYSFKYEIAFN